MPCVCVPHDAPWCLECFTRSSRKRHGTQLFATCTPCCAPYWTLPCSSLSYTEYQFRRLGRNLPARKRLGFLKLQGSSAHCEANEISEWMDRVGHLITIIRVGPWTCTKSDSPSNLPRGSLADFDISATLPSLRGTEYCCKLSVVDRIKTTNEGAIYIVRRTDGVQTCGVFLGKSDIPTTAG